MTDSGERWILSLPLRNFGQLYGRMAEMIRQGERVDANFIEALAVHKLLEAVRRSSVEGKVSKDLSLGRSRKLPYYGKTSQ